MKVMNLLGRELTGQEQRSWKLPHLQALTLTAAVFVALAIHCVLPPERVPAVSTCMSLLEGSFILEACFASENNRLKRLGNYCFLSLSLNQRSQELVFKYFLLRYLHSGTTLRSTFYLVPRVPEAMLSSRFPYLNPQEGMPILIL